MDKNQRNKILYHAGVTFVALSMSIAFFFLLYRFGEIGAWLGKVWNALGPFIYGAAIAYVLSPVCDFFQMLFTSLLKKMKVKKPNGPANGLAVSVTLLLAIMIIYFLIRSLLPELYDSLYKLATEFPSYISNAESWAESKLSKQPEMLKYFNDAMNSSEDFISNWVQNSILPNIETIIANVTNSVANILGFIETAFISIIVAAYVLAGRKKVVAKLKLYLMSIFKEKHFNVIWEELIFTDKMFSGFISGKVIDSAIIGVMTFVSLSIWDMIAGFDYILLISVVIGVTNIIPFFGPFIGAIPCAFLILLESPMKCLGFVIFIVVLQQIDGNVLGPKVLGNATGISSFGVLFSVMFFGSLWGFIGMLVGVPVYGILADILRKFIEKGLRKHDHDDIADAYVTENNELYEPEEKQSIEEKWKNRFASMKDVVTKADKEMEEAIEKVKKGKWRFKEEHTENQVASQKEEHTENQAASQKEEETKNQVASQKEEHTENQAASQKEDRTKNQTAPGVDAKEENFEDFTGES